jgi:hypothetical protein
VRAHLVDVLTPAQLRALGEAMEAVGLALQQGCAAAADAEGARA